MADIVDFLREPVNLGGSDLHVSAWAPACARVNGVLQALTQESLEPEATRDFIFDALTEKQRATLEADLELDYALHVEGVGRFRGNVHMVRGNVEAAFRFINQQIPEIETLGHEPIVPALCGKRSGLILVTGVTGSGKSTTLASMVKRISGTRSGVIITLEDPIEYLYQHSSCLIKQREVGGDTKSFPKALRQSLRQDPDIIVVSELRDLDTIRIAMIAAETGHLVLSTLHTPDAPQSIDRLVDVFSPDQQPQIVSQLASCLEAIVSQRLLPSAHGNSRVLATEVMIPGHGIRTCIRDRKLEQILGLMEIGAQDGNHTIDECLEKLLRAGQITREEALFHCRDAKLFQEEPKPQKKSSSLWT